MEAHIIPDQSSSSITDVPVRHLRSGGIPTRYLFDDESGITRECVLQS